MYEIPTAIEIDGDQFQIRNNGDYRMVLDCFSALNDVELSKEERLFASLIIFYEDINSIEDVIALNDVEHMVQEMYKFFNCGKGDNDVGTHSNYKLLDWELDEHLVSSAINKVANTEIRLEPYIHWWTFMGYYTAIGDCPLSTIIGIRDKIVKGTKLEKHEQKFRRENPQYFVWNSKSVDAYEADDLARQLWGVGGDE